MSYLFPSRLRWHGRHYAEYFGWPGAVALTLLAAGLLLLLAVLQPLDRQLESVQQDIRRLSLSSKGKTVALASVASPAQQLANFYHFFPAQEDRLNLMAGLYAAATQCNVNLGQGEYRLTRDQATKLMRYEIILPIKADYLRIRQFLALVLAKMPSLSLDGISFTRQVIDDPSVEAQLRLTLYLAAE